MECSTAVQTAYAVGEVVCINAPAAGWQSYVLPGLALCSFITAIVAIITTRAVARQKATLDLIEKRESTDLYRQLASDFSKVRRRPGGFASLNNPKTDADKSDRQKVVRYLNHYELISIGILNGILDDKIYRTWMRGAFTRDWNAAADWIQRERWKRDKGEWSYYDRLFENYGRVAKRWSNEVRVLTKKSGGPPSGADIGGPGDEALPAPPGEEVKQAENNG